MTTFNIFKNSTFFAGCLSRPADEQSRFYQRTSRFVHTGAKHHAMKMKKAGKFPGEKGFKGKKGKKGKKGFEGKKGKMEPEVSKEL